MRTELYESRTIGEPVIKVVLSRRNLETLIAKLDGHPGNSEKTLVGPTMYPITVVVAEENEEHYSHESREGVAAGEVHHETLAAMNVGARKDQ